MAIGKFFVITIIGMLVLAVQATASEEAKSAGSSSGNTVLQRYGSKEGFKKNLATPMTNNTTQMQTIDGSSSFSAAMGAPSSNKFLEIMIQPSGAGDLKTVIVGQDLNSDGAFDHTFTLGVPVSGICANGFISCSPGTWESCKAYKWVSDETGRLAVELDGITHLAGCYCINSSCGSSLAWSNSAILLKDLGGGAVGAIHKKDATVMISDVRTDFTTVTYYGQLVRSAKTAADEVPVVSKSIPSTVMQQAYYGNWSGLDADAGSISTIQSADPGSMYYQIAHSSALQSAVETKTCSVRRDGVLNSQPTATYSDSGHMYFLTEHYIDMQIWQSQDKQTYKLQLMDHFAGVDHYGTMGRSDHEPMDSNGWHTIHTFTLPVNTATIQSKLTRAIFSVKLVSGAGCVAGSIYTIDGVLQGFNTRVNVGGYCKDGGVQQPYLEWSYYFEFSTDTYKEGVSNTCSSLESDSTCRLRDEKIDGVVIYRDFARTRLNQLPSCKTFDGVVQPMDVCRDWWRKERTYVCENGPGFNLDDAKKRFNSVGRSSSDSTNMMTYEDYRKDDSGNWIKEKKTVGLPGRDQHPDCDNACKVKRPKIDTQVGVQGVIAGNRATNESHDFVYLNCDSDNICPAGPEDIIVMPCQCIADFGQAATVMQTMRLSGADNICSSGKLLPP